MGTKAHKEKVWNMISDIGVGMLVTQDGFDLRSRPMQLIQDSYDGKIWFYTNLNDNKSDEIKEDRNICLIFSCPKSKTYVSLTGTASISKDKNLINKFWSPFVAAWFPEGKDDPSCALIELKINHGEHWDANVGKVEYLYEVAKANFSNSTPANNSSIVNERF